MAKKTESPRGTGEINFIMFSLRGGDDTLQQSFRTIGQALENAFQRTKTIQLKSESQHSAFLEQQTETDLIEPEADLENGEVPAKSGSPRPAKKPIYKTVADLNLKPDDAQSLRDFFHEKRPESQQEQFVVILFYLTKILNLSGIGLNHIYTAFNDVGKRVPNIRSSAQNIARRRGWIDVSDMNDLKMTTPGENFVKHDLPRTGTVSDSTDEEE